MFDIERLAQNSIMIKNHQVHNIASSLYIIYVQHMMNTYCISGIVPWNWDYNHKQTEILLMPSWNLPFTE